MSVHDEAAHIGEVDHLERGVLVHLAGIGDDVALPGGGDHGLVAGDFLEVRVADAFAQIDGGNAAETFVNGEERMKSAASVPMTEPDLERSLPPGM